MGSEAFTIFLSLSFLFLSVILSSASEEIDSIRRLDGLYHSHTVQVSSLLPSSVCSPSNRGSRTKSSLKVVHKHGRCSKQNQEIVTQFTDHADILRRDQARVNSIHARVSRISPQKAKESRSAVLPAKSGSAIGAANYIVSVGLGTPKKDMSLTFDTGSDITWTQCQPCVKSCYSQKDPIFNPSLSTSYTNISCSSDICSSLASATGNAGACSSSTCVYGIQYGDQSFSVGFLAKEKLTLTKSDVFDGFVFGCGENNQGLFVGSAGLLGLGRDQLSFPSQTASAYKKVFSYCLPSSSGSVGHLTFGSAGIPRSVKYTPLSAAGSDSSLYGLDIVAIRVGGLKLRVPINVYTDAGAIIDSGTVVTRLPPRAYAALRTAFRSKMSAYKNTTAFSILDTCYDLSGLQTVTFPTIGFVFKGGVELNIPAVGLVYAAKITQVCLAFAGNSDDSSVAIFGNLQQQTLDVVYDGAAGKVGFAPGGCK